MNDRTSSHGSARRAGALAAVAVIAALTTACDVVHVHVGSSVPASTSTGSSTYQQHLAYAHCMQSHGMPGFPDPVPNTSFSGQLNASPGTVAARADDACKHLLSASAAGPTGPAAQSPSSSAAGAVVDSLASGSTRYTAAQLRVAYGVRPLLGRRATGRGQTVVLLDFPPAGGPARAAGAGQVPTVTLRLGLTHGGVIELSAGAGEQCA